jgi:hypothetical protein
VSHLRNSPVVALTLCREELSGAGSHSCCNLTAYVDDVVISESCVGYYWTTTHSVYNGPFAEDKFRFIRAPAAVYRATNSNPTLSYNVVCPASNGLVGVSSVTMYNVSLVPRCTCQEEDHFQSIKSQPRNAAFNGNFADYDLTQENPVSGWISQESWRSMVMPVQYNGPAPADDTSNKGSV